MADVLDLLTLVEGKRAINLADSSVQHDTELAQFITAISRRIDDLCGPVVVRTISDELHDGGSTRFFLDHQPVLSITTVTEYSSGSPTVLAAESVGTAGDYTLREGFLVRRSGWTNMKWTGQAVVTYVAGRYASTAAVDAKFKTAAGSVLRRLWSREASAWSTGGSVYSTEDAGFFKAVDPMVTEFLSSELRAPVLVG